MQEHISLKSRMFIKNERHKSVSENFNTMPMVKARPYWVNDSDYSVVHKPTVSFDNHPTPRQTFNETENTAEREELVMSRPDTFGRRVRNSTQQSSTDFREGTREASDFEFEAIDST